MMRVLCLILLLMLGACSSETGEDKLRVYAERLGNVLDSVSNKERTVPVRSAMRYPEQSQILTPLNAQNALSPKINLLDFLSLHGCRLQTVIAESNSSLGKFAANSQRLLSALEFLRLAPECIQQLYADDNIPLAEAVSSEMERKREQFLLMFARATIADDELHSFWRLPQSLADYPQNTGSEPVQALARLSVLAGFWQNGQYGKGLAEFENVLGLVRAGDGGALLKSYALLDAYLDGLNAYLDSVLSSPLLCQRNDVFSPAILSNVVQKYFVQDVQVWAADLNRRYYAIQSAMEPLENILKAYTSDTYKRWSAGRGALAESVKSRLQQHVAKLRVLLEPANLKEWCKREQ